MKKPYLLLLCSLLFLSLTKINSKVAKADNITTEENNALTSVMALRNNLDLLNEDRSQAGYHTAVTSFTFSPITIDSYREQNIAGFIVDFDGDKGYIVLGPNMTFYDDSYVGNSPVPMSNAIEKHYSDFSGYYYYDENGDKIELGRVNDPTYNTDSVEIMDGQMAAGESLITDVVAYNTDKYGSGYVFEAGKSIFAGIYMPAYMDMHLAYYYIYNNGYMTYPEMGGYTTGYNIGKYLAFALNNVSYKGQQEVVNYSPSTNETNNYTYFLNQGYSAVGSKTITTYESAYRNKTLYIYDHEDNLTVAETYNVLAHLYSGQVSYTSYTGDNFVYTEMSVFENNFPVIFEFTNSDYYGQRIFPLCGYKTYIKTNRHLFYTSVDVRYYLEYKDGTTNENSMYIDYNFCLCKIGSIFSVEF